MLGKALSGALIGFFCLTTANLHADKDKDYWAETSVDFSLISYFMQIGYPCHESPVNFLSCVNLINDLAASFKPNQILIPKGYKNLYGEIITRPIEDLGAFERVEILGFNHMNLSLRQSIQIRKTQLNAIAETAKTAFDANPNFDFEGLAQRLVNELPEGISKKRAMGEAVNAMMTTIDGHSHLQPTAQVEAESHSIGDSFIGISARLQSAPEGALVVETFEDGPADKAGIQEGDLIEKVNDQSVKGFELTDIVSQIRGVANTPVRLTLARADSPPIEIEVTRKPFIRKTIDPKMVSDFGPKFMRIRIGNFIGESTCSDVKNILSNMPNDTKGIILDLRGDPGGLLDAGVCVSGLFVGKKVITRLRSVVDGKINQRSRPREEVSDVDQVTDLPMVVLINSNSASASEIVAGALQDYKRAYIMGTTSFGKGSAQQQYGFPLFGGELSWFKTVSRFYQPDDHTNQVVGIKPDFEVFSVPNPTEDQKYEPREEDSVPAALTAIGTPWTQPRPGLINGLKNICFKSHQAETRFKDESLKKSQRDFQLFSAEQLLGCLTNGGSLQQAQLDRPK